MLIINRRCNFEQCKWYKIGIVDMMNKHVENVMSIINSEIYQMIKSLGFKGEVYELGEIQNWLEGSGYTIQASSMNHNGVNIKQYNIKENEKVLKSVIVRDFYEDGEIKTQISKEDYTSNKPKS